MGVELARRPGANLLRLLKKQGRDLTEFAVEVGMGSQPRHALANVRQYTHGQEPPWPRVEMVQRWATALNVDPGEFYRDVK